MNQNDDMVETARDYANKMVAADRQNQVHKLLGAQSEIGSALLRAKAEKYGATSMDNPDHPANAFMNGGLLVLRELDKHLQKAKEEAYK